jgi:multimeric flavodoxin WrbA
LFNLLVEDGRIKFFEEKFKMKIAAIMGSPRKGGNTDTLLDEFLRGVSEGGGEAEKILIGELEIEPCRELLECEKTGRCPIEDEAESVFDKLLAAERIVIASPIFFYGLPARLKALIDRGQSLWARQRLSGNREEEPPKEAFALLLGATRGEELFDGALLTLKYFLRTVNFRITGKLLFREIEKKGDIRKHPTALDEAFRAGREFGRD